MTIVPDSVVVSFFSEATKALQELQTTTTSESTISSTSVTVTRKCSNGISLAECRKMVLDQQLCCLDTVVAHYNNANEANIFKEDVQDRLRHLKSEGAISEEIQNGMNTMNDVARLSLCYLILYSEYIQEMKRVATASSLSSSNSFSQQQSILRNSGNMERSEILEYCALCNAVIKLDNVKNHLSGEQQQLFTIEYYYSNDNEKVNIDQSVMRQITPMFSTRRIEKVQQLLMRGIGYDEVHGTAELKRIFATPDKQNEYSDDHELIQLFKVCCSNAIAAITNAECHNDKLLNTYSDKDTGGVTRILSVNYSEKIIDPSKDITAQLIQHAKTKSNTNSNGNAAPEQEQMDIRTDIDLDETKRQQLQMAKQASLLQQSILQELQSMSESEREYTLKEAKIAEQKFMEQAMQIPPGPDRIAFLRNVNPSTQKLLAMKRIWEQANINN